MLVLKLEHALARGAEVIAKLQAAVLLPMPIILQHLTPAGLGAKNVMITTLKDAGMNPGDIDYINVHGTSTPLGDIAETKAILDVFGDHAYNLNISSTKSMTGHCLGAAGALEALACILAVTQNIVPPLLTILLTTPSWIPSSILL